MVAQHRRKRARENGSVPSDKRRWPRPIRPDGGGRAIRTERLRPPRLTRLLKTAALNDAHKSPPPKLVPKGGELDWDKQRSVAQLPEIWPGPAGPGPAGPAGPTGPSEPSHGPRPDLN